MAWQKLATTTLSVAGDTITATITATKLIVQSLAHFLQSGALNVTTRVNSDSGANYAFRQSNNGGADSTTTGATEIAGSQGGVAQDGLMIEEILDITAQEKLFIIHYAGANTAGAANPPQRMEVAAKWANTSVQFGNVQTVNLGAGDFAIDSNGSVLGTD